MVCMEETKSRIRHEIGQGHALGGLKAKEPSNDWCNMPSCLQFPYSHKKMDMLSDC